MDKQGPILAVPPPSALAGCLPSYFEKPMGSQGAERDLQNRFLSLSIRRIYCLPVTRARSVSHAGNIRLTDGEIKYSFCN